MHPGETVSSWMMKGILDYLLDPNSAESHLLREHFIFKIVPMLNPDGVIHGNYRCSLAGVDLNRRWKNPNKLLHPEIYYTKKMIKEFRSKTPIILYVDLHGHSRKKSVFMYGCHDEQNPGATREIPFLLSRINKNFSFNECNFVI